MDSTMDEKLLFFPIKTNKITPSGDEIICG